MFTPVYTGVQRRKLNQARPLLYRGVDTQASDFTNFFLKWKIIAPTFIKPRYSSVAVLFSSRPVTSICLGFFHPKISNEYCCDALRLPVGPSTSTYITAFWMSNQRGDCPKNVPNMYTSVPPLVIFFENEAVNGEWGDILINLQCMVLFRLNFFVMTDWKTVLWSVWKPIYYNSWFAKIQYLW